MLDVEVPYLLDHFQIGPRVEVKLLLSLVNLANSLLKLLFDHEVKCFVEDVVQVGAIHHSVVIALTAEAAHMYEAVVLMVIDLVSDIKEVLLSMRIMTTSSA